MSIELPPNYRGYYSAEQERRTGCVHTYMALDGSHVTVSMVGSAPPNFSDVIDRGPVVAYVGTTTVNAAQSRLWRLA